MPTARRLLASSPAARSPHPATVPRGSAVQPKMGNKASGPHPATVPRGSAVQPRMAKDARAPHPATVPRGSAVQPKMGNKASGPHPATVPRGSAVQPKRADGSRGPHPATVPRGGAAQPRMAGAARPPHSATVSRQERSSNGDLVAQRMEESTTVKLKSLEGAYAEFYNLLSKYSLDSVKDGKVLRWLQIGQALGLKAPENWGHASQSSGGDGEGERGKKNKEYYDEWFKTNKNALEKAKVASTEKTKTKGLEHNKEQKDKVVKEKEVLKVKKKANKHELWHQNNPREKCTLCGEIGLI